MQKPFEPESLTIANMVSGLKTSKKRVKYLMQKRNSDRIELDGQYGVSLNRTKKPNWFEPEICGKIRVQIQLESHQMDNMVSGFKNVEK